MSAIFTLPPDQFVGFESLYRFIGPEHTHLKKSVKVQDIAGFPIPRAEVFAGKACLEEFFTDPIYQTFAVPTDEGLCLLAFRLKMKYGIPITIVKKRSDLEPAFSGAFSEKASFYGIIVLSEDNSSLHVTPYLCHQSEEGLLEIANLDSVQDPYEDVENYIASLIAKDAGLIYLKTGQKRQADEYSCRTEALSILKQALLLIKQHEAPKLVDLFKPKLDEETQKLVFDIPSSMAKSCQTSASITGKFEEIVFGKKKESLADFFARFIVTTQKTRILSFSRIDPATPFSYKKMKAETPFEKKISTYLLQKGFRNFLALQKFLAKADKQTQDLVDEARRLVL
jgi:hypothetical protein